MTDIEYRSADGLTLYAKAYGPPHAALTVLCMHGLTRNHQDFEPMITALGDRYRFIAVDVRGRGRSNRASDPATYTPQVYARDMGALLDTLGLAQVALIGTSMGGLMSMVMAKTMPKRLLGVVLNDVGPVLDRAGLDRIAAYAGKIVPFSDWDAAAAAIARTQSDIFPHYGPEDWLAFARRTCRETDAGEIVFDYDPAITRTVSDVRPGFLTRIAMWRLFNALKPTPLLVIRGETSDILAPATARRMVRRHPRASLTTVPGVGHAPMLDEPEAVAAISSFLETLKARP